MQGELVAKFGYPVCKMDTGYLYVFKEQSHPGRLILAHDKHISEMIELTDEERNSFFADLAKAAKAIHKVYQPKKVNYGAYGDTGCHLHFHLVPKYEGEYEYGGVFEMNPGRVVISEEECEVIAQKIREALAEL